MGTSADYGGRTGGAWTPHKRAATDYVRQHGGQDRRRKVLATYARAVASGHAVGGGGAGGGGGAAGGGGRVGSGAVAPGQALAAFGASLADSGLGDALQALDLGHLIGGDRYEVLDGLFDALAGDGSTLDEANTQQALVAALTEVFPADAQDYDDLAAVQLDAADVTDVVETFITEYVYSDVSHLLGQRLQECRDAAEQRRLDDDLRDTIRSLVKIEVGDRDRLRVDWRGTEGREILVAVTENLQVVMEDLDQ